MIPEPFAWLSPPRDLSLVQEEIHVWRIPLDVSAEAAAGLVDTLSAEERARMIAYRFERHGLDFAVSRARLRVVLAGYVGARPGELQFDYAKHGKPMLRLSSCQPAIHFNVSHSGRRSVLAVARGREVGVDIEKIRPFPEAEAIAARFFTPGERDSLGRLPPAEKESGFFRCWTRKEAYIKARGEGLTFPLDRFEVTLAEDRPALLCHVDGQIDEARRWWMADLQPGPGYVGAIVAEGEPARLQLWDFPEDHN